MQNNSTVKGGLSILLRFLMSWVGIFLLLSTLLIALDQHPAARATLVVFFGILGAFAGYRMHYGRPNQNPFYTLRRQWKVPRIAWILGVAISALLLSIWLLMQGVSIEPGASKLVGLYLAAANGFFFFAATYGVGGLLATSDAKLRIKQATFDVKQRWREQAGQNQAPNLDMRALIETAFRLPPLPWTQTIGAQTESDRRN